MLVVDEETAAAIRRAWNEGGELSAVIELRRHFPLISGGEPRASACAPSWAGHSLGTQDASARLDLVRSMDRPTGQYTLSFTGEITAMGSSPSPVPEPASMAVLGTGLFGLGLTRRRRKAR